MIVYRMFAACAITGLVGLGAEVVFTGLKSRGRWGWAAPWYALCYATAPPLILLLALWIPLPWRLPVELALINVADQLVRVQEHDTLAARLRFLLLWGWAWTPVVVLLEIIAGAV